MARFCCTSAFVMDTLFITRLQFLMLFVFILTCAKGCGGQTFPPTADNSNPGGLDNTPQKEPTTQSSEMAHQLNNLTMVNISLSICTSVSCEGQCPNKFSLERVCQCDELCIYAGDCCADYFQKCRNISDDDELVSFVNDSCSRADDYPERNNKANLAYVLTKYGECVAMDTGMNTIVTSCPDDFADADIKRQCHDTNMTSPVSLVNEPVLVFRNSYCAECHGVEVSETEKWITRLQCTTEKTLTAYDVVRAYKNGECKTVLVPAQQTTGTPLSCHFFSPVVSAIDDLDCVGHFCSAREKLLCQAYSLPVVRRANNTDNPSLPDDVSTRFRNPHCMKCCASLGEDDYDHIDCSLTRDGGGGQHEAIPSHDKKPGGILTMFDLSEDGSGLMVNGKLITWPGFGCQDDEVYDYITKTCRQVICSPGHVLENNQCVRGDTVVTGDSQLLGNGTDGFVVQLWLNYDDTLVCDSVGTGQGKQASAYEVSEELQQHFDLYDIRLDFTHTVSVLSVSCSENAWQIVLSIDDGHSFTEAYKHIKNMLPNPFSHTGHTSAVMMNITVSNTRTLPSSVCPDGSLPFIVDDASTTEKDGKIFVVSTKHGFKQLFPMENVLFNVTFSYQDLLAVQIKDKDDCDDDKTDGQKFQGGAEEKCNDKQSKPERRKAKEVSSSSSSSSSSPFSSSSSSPSSSPPPHPRLPSGKTSNNFKPYGPKKEEDTSPVHFVVSAELCDPPTSNTSLTCPAIAYPRNETRIENNTLVVESTGMVFAADEYEIIDEDQVLVCSRFKNYNDIWSKLRMFDFSPTKRYVALALSAFSMICLILVLTVYCLLPELRNLPGKITVCHVGSLLAGHLTLNIAIPTCKVCCCVIAALSHFVWLAAFAWISALAVHMADTFFTTSASQKSRYEAEIAFRKYSLACWGLPLALVVTCAALDSAPSVDVKVDYGGRTCGWIGEPKTIIWAFFLPLGVSLLVNLLAFLAAVFGIERTTRASKLASSSRRSEGKRLLVYVKMSAALGFTWVLGLGVAFGEWDWLEWVFVVLNSLQGAFISLAFLVNERVLRMLKKKLMGKARMEKKSTTFLSTSDIQTKSECVSEKSVSDGRV